MQNKILREIESTNQSEFLACMSQELQTPLDAIREMASLLNDSNLSPIQRNYLSILNSASEQVSGLLNDILDLSTIEAGYACLEAHEFNLMQCAARIEESVVSHAQINGLHLKLKIQDNLPTHVIGDENRLTQILTRLCRFLLENMETGALSVSIMRGEEGPLHQDIFPLAVTIQSKTAHISQYNTSEIFNLVSFASDSVLRRATGGGINLAICQRLVGLMGGKLWVDYDHKYAESFKFQLRIPLPEFEMERLMPNSASHTIKVLLVEDSIDNQLIVCAFLKPPQFKVETAINGIEGLKRFFSGKYDFILADLQMPVMDGFRMIEAVRNFESQSGKQPIPIVSLSATSSSDDLLKSQKAGATGHLTKPLNAFELKDMIQSILRFETQENVEDRFVATSGESSPSDTSESILRQMIPIFLANRAKDLVKIRSLLDIADFDSIRLIGHSMKGSGHSYGFDNISTLGTKLELAAKDNNIELINETLAEINAWLISFKGVPYTLKKLSNADIARRFIF